MNKIIISLILVLFSLGFVFASSCDYVISSCQELNQSNTVYCVDSNVSALEEANCFDIIGDNIVLDGMWYLIEGNDPSMAVTLEGNNITLMNFELSSALNQNAIYGDNVTNSYIFNITQPNAVGIQLVDNSINNTISDVWFYFLYDKNMQDSPSDWNHYYNNTVDYSYQCFGKYCEIYENGISPLSYLSGSNIISMTIINPNMTSENVAYTLGYNVANSLFNYKYRNIWLNSSFNKSSSGMFQFHSRKLLDAWNDSFVHFNDSRTSGVVALATYNISGLYPNLEFEVLNNGVSVYNLTTDSNGVLPSFDIWLGSEHEIEILGLSPVITTTTTTTSTTTSTSTTLTLTTTTTVINSAGNVIKDIGEGTSNFLDVIKVPLTNILLGLGLVSVVLFIIYALFKGLNDNIKSENIV